MNQARLAQINEILKDLYELRESNFENQYAVEENIKFFEAMRSPLKYIKWLINERPKIDGSRLLELSDFHFHDGKWERILQQELLEIERWRFPDNLLQFRKELLKQISELSKFYGDRTLLLMGLGSGPMEIERQIINKLKKENSVQKIVFIGVDNSQTSLDVAKNNLNELNIPIIQVDSLKPNELEAIKVKYIGYQFIIILLKSDVFALNHFFSKKSIDLIYHSKFKHHFSGNQKKQIDDIVRYLSNRVIEDDMLNNLFMFIVPLIIRSRWFHPILQNGGVFSSLRCPTKALLRLSQNEKEIVKFRPDGYLKIFL